MAEYSLNEVRRYARRIHHGQSRRGGVPYINHLIEVAELCAKIYDRKEVDLPFERTDILAAALLHDSIEDTAADFEDIENASNRQVAEWVSLLSEDKRLPKSIRKPDYIKQVSNAGIVVQVIKVADLYSNVAGITFEEDEGWIHQYLAGALVTLKTLRKVKDTSLALECNSTINRNLERLRFES